jgi:hypothetical protein
MTTLSTRHECRCALVLALTLLSMAGCQTAPTVTSDTAPGAKVDAYRTFGFMEKSGTDTPAYTTLTTRYFQEAVTREMVARGYEFSNEPELLVDFSVGIASEQKKSGRGVSVGAGGTSGGSSAAGVGVNLGSLFGGKGADSVVRIDVVDRQQKQVIWGGSVTQRVPADQMEFTQEMIDAAVATIFAKYPKPATATMQKSEPPPPG